MKKITAYACSVCGATYPTRIKAETCEGQIVEQIVSIGDIVTVQVDRSAASPEGSAGLDVTRLQTLIELTAKDRARDAEMCLTIDRASPNAANADHDAAQLRALGSALPSLIDASTERDRLGNELLELRRVAGLRMPTEEDHLRAQLTEAGATLERRSGAQRHDEPRRRDIRSDLVWASGESLMRPNEPFYTVPKGSKPAKCKGDDCKKEIYYVERPRRNKPGTFRMPVDVDVPGGSAPDSLTDGKGVSHFSTCVNADDF